ncbi:hypothetical protein Tco_0000100 [Tanacetum coccineum]
MELSKEKRIPKFFHGIINKKRFFLIWRFAVVFVEGLWCTDPSIVRRRHLRITLRVRFHNPVSERHKLKCLLLFHNRYISSDQVDELDRADRGNGIRKAV